MSCCPQGPVHHGTYAEALRWGESLQAWLALSSTFQPMQKLLFTWLMSGLRLVWSDKPGIYHVSSPHHNSSQEFSIRVDHTTTASMGCCAATTPARLCVHHWASSHTQFDSLTHKQGSLHKHMEEEKGVTYTPGSAPRHKFELHKSRAHACTHVSERH